jgi:hypothetical protein
VRAFAKTSLLPGASLSTGSVITRVVRVAGGRFAPGQVGELTRIVPFEMVGAAVFGTDRVGEVSYAGDLVRSVRRGMIVLADRNFAVAAWIDAVADAGADALVRVKIGRQLPICRRLPDGSYLARLGTAEVRVITATIALCTSAGRRKEVYRLVTTIADPNCPAAEIVGLYHPFRRRSLTPPPTP